MGSAVIFMAGQKFLSGGLHGNGPADRTKRQTWIDAGWRPRTIKIGDAWVSYDAFEPFNQILSIIGGNNGTTKSGYSYFVLPGNKTDSNQKNLF